MPDESSSALHHATMCASLPHSEGGEGASLFTGGHPICWTRRKCWNGSDSKCHLTNACTTLDVSSTMNNQWGWQIYHIYIYKFLEFLFVIRPSKNRGGGRENPQVSSHGPELYLYQFRPHSHISASTFDLRGGIDKVFFNQGVIEDKKEEDKDIPMSKMPCDENGAGCAKSGAGGVRWQHGTTAQTWDKGWEFLSPYVKSVLTLKLKNKMCEKNRAKIAKDLLLTIILAQPLAVVWCDISPHGCRNFEIPH